MLTPPAAWEHPAQYGPVAIHALIGKGDWPLGQVIGSDRGGLSPTHPKVIRVYPVPGALVFTVLVVNNDAGIRVAVLACSAAVRTL
jgi:hypothetical protein